MTELRIEEHTEVTVDDVPALKDDDPLYCHIDDGSGVQTYCGRLAALPLAGGGCRPYETGDEVCPSCGRENCPTCVEMASLNDELED